MAELGNIEITVRALIRIEKGLYLNPMNYTKIERTGEYMEFHKRGDEISDRYHDPDEYILRQLEDIYKGFE